MPSAFPRCCKSGGIGGADPLVRAGPPGPAAATTVSASCKVRGGRPGGRPRTRGSAPPFARMTPLPAVPAQAQAVLAVGGFQGDAVDLIALVHGNPHGAVQAAVFGHRVHFPSSALAGQYLAGEGERAAAVFAAEPCHHLAATVDVDGHFAQPHFAGIVGGCRAAPDAPEVQDVVPTEASLGGARPIDVVITARGAPVGIPAGHRPTDAEMIPSLATLAVADVHNGGETVAARGFPYQAHLAAALNVLKAEACDIAVGQRGVEIGRAHV